MKTEKTIEIIFNNNKYVIEYKKILAVLSALENKKMESLSEAEISALMKKYNLLDEIFLDNINKIFKYKNA